MREKRMKVGVAAGLLCLAPTIALAEGCSLADGITVTKVEALNQMMLDLDIDRFSETVRQELGGDIADQMSQLSEMFQDGFHGCATIVQRVDRGGMVQNLVMFDGKVGPLYFYWAAVKEGEREVILFLRFSTSLGDVMAELR
jgi:hypothetical protein